MTKLDQQLITNAALTIIEASDASDLTLSAIARELEVTQPALYYHVDGISDVLRWVGIEVRRDLAETLASATIGLAHTNAVAAASNAWRSFGLSRPAAYRSTNWYPVEGDPELESAVTGVLTVLAGSLRGFDLDDDHLAYGALALRSALHGFVSFELGSGNPSPQHADDGFDHVIQLFVAGLTALSER